MLRHLRIGAAILLEIVGVVLHDAETGVAEVRRRAFRCRAGVGRLDREAPVQAARGLDLQRPEPAVAGVQHRIEERIEIRIRQPGMIGRIVEVEGRRARRHRVEVTVDQQLAHLAADEADADADLGPEFALERDVVLEHLGTLQVQVDGVDPEEAARADGAGGETLGEHRRVVADAVAERRAREGVTHALRRRGRIEQSGAAADDGGLRDAPSEADARADVVGVGVDQARPHPGLIRRFLRHRRDRLGRQEPRDAGIRQDERAGDGIEVD